MSDHTNKRLVNRAGELLAIKERRDSHRYTRRELEKLLGISITSIQNWLHNRVSQYSETQIEAWATFLECKPGDLFTWEDAPDNPEANALLDAIPA